MTDHETTDSLAARQITGAATWMILILIMGAGATIWILWQKAHVPDSTVSAPQISKNAP